MAETKRMANPLLDAWHEVYGPNAAEVGFDRDFALNVNAYTTRSEMIRRYSFAVPSEDALDLIASFGPVVEIGAGTGYWAMMLRQRGCSVAAYDVMGDPWRKWFPNGLADQVLPGGVEKAAVHAHRTLLLVWPYMDSMAFDAVTAYSKAGGQRVIYVGEGIGGCTANDDFFMLMGGECDRAQWDDEHDCSTHPTPAWQEVKSMPVPQWDGIHDYLTVYERLAASSARSSGDAGAHDATHAEAGHD